MSQIEVKSITLGPVLTNSYLVINRQTGQVIVIDPAADADRFIRYFGNESLTPIAILLTHGHFDHIMAVNELRDRYKIKVYADQAEEDVLGDVRLNMSSMIGRRYTTYADEYLADGDVLDLAGCRIMTFHTPGHTHGGCCYYFPDQKMVFSGDTLFHTSIGRTDFPTGSMSQLVRSVREKLFPLPDDTTVYPGHDDVTSIGYEKKYNMFCGGDL